jgi:hypothetical protein
MSSHLASSERPPQCPARMPSDWSQCEKAAGHAGSHYVYLKGFGPWTWPNTGAGVRA